MPMRLAFAQSLRFKITLRAVLLVVLILGAFSILQYVRHRDLLLANLERSTTTMGQVITGSLQHAMLNRDFSEIQQIIDNVAQQREIVGLVLLNKAGEIRIAPQGERVGTRLNQQDPECQVCHSHASELRKGSVILERPGGRVFRTMTPIENRVECHACHDPSSRLNGVLMSDFSMAVIDQHLEADLRNALLWAVAAITATTVTINALMSRLVVTKLERLAEVIKLFGRGDLRQRVAMQSSDEIGELAETFNRMATGLEDKDRENVRLYAELQQKEAARAKLLEALIDAQEEERKRVARDLHDQLGAILSGLTMNIEAAEQSLPEQNTLKERLQRTKTLATQALEETHKLILDLRPEVLDELGLVAAVRADAEARLQPRGIDVQVSIAGARRRLTPQLELTVFRIAQEAVNNIAKHAQAQRAQIAFEFRDAAVGVVIADDGQGFDLHGVSSTEDKTRGLGLLGMTERAHLAGGSLQIESHAGRGTRITITMPVPDVRS